MDFFNYAGIHRPVKLYTVAADISLEDVFISTSLNQDQSVAKVNFDLYVCELIQCI